MQPELLFKGHHRQRNWTRNLNDSPSAAHRIVERDRRRAADPRHGSSRHRHNGAVYVPCADGRPFFGEEDGCAGKAFTADRHRYFDHWNR